MCTKHLGGLCVLIWLSLGASSLSATISTYTFEDDALRERYQSLTAELRCPKCQNQNIADSDAPIATDMRDEVYRQLMAGASDQAIIDAMVGRFGEFVHYRPQFEPRTWLLWLAPAVAALIGVLVVVIMGLRSRRTSTAVVLDDQARARLAELLKEDGVPSSQAVDNNRESR